MKKNAETHWKKIKEIKRVCQTCVFIDLGDARRENCLRFARFVDHALHDASKDCDYWTPAMR